MTPYIADTDAIHARSVVLTALQDERTWCRTDRAFALLMVFQWIGGIVLALVLSPYTWAGTTARIHPHVWSAIFLGAAISLFPIIMARKCPGRTLTRHVIAAGQILSGSLLIHLSGGRIETHFHIFGSLAFLAFYRDSRVIVTATFIIALDHLVRGLWWPQSVYGMLTPEFGRTAEHAFWVAFEDVFLFVSLRHAREDVRAGAMQQARLEALTAEIEERVVLRTAELTASTASLRATETEARRLATVASRTSNGVIITDAQGCIEWVNDGFTRITEYTLEEAVGRTPGSFLQGALTDSASVAQMRAGMKAQQGFNVEIINYAKSGRHYWLAVEVQPLRDVNGLVTGFMAIESDITQRKRGEQKLLASEKRLTSLTAQAPGVIFQFESAKTGRRSFTFLSDGYSSLFGRDPAEVLRRPMVLFASVHRHDIAGVRRSLNEAIACGTAWIYAFRILTPTGVVRWINARSSFLLRPDGTKVWFGMLADITDQQQVRIAAEELNVKLAAADCAKNRYLGMAAHDLRNPLVTVRGFAEFLRDGAVGPLTGEQLELVSLIHSSSCGMLNMVNDLLDVAVIEAGELKLNIKPHDFGAIIEKSVYLAGLESAKKRTRIVFEPPAAMSPVQLDSDRMKQVVDNLLSNAVKYSPPGSTITVKLYADDAHCGFSVSDQGPGIPEKERSKLFKDFGRLSAVPTGGESSTGLGLAICRKIVEAHDGAIIAENLPDVGCAFRVTLPTSRAVALASIAR